MAPGGGRGAGAGGRPAGDRGGPVNPATALATVLVYELLRAGLSDAVLAPGSRSAPLALALHEAMRAGWLRLHVRVDERSAAFAALGIAKISGRPVALVCTSGTAAVNFHPAVVEAHAAGVPLIVLTADRPPELRDTGANQTIDQLKLYGSAVRWHCEVGAPEERPGMVASWRGVRGGASGWTATWPGRGRGSGRPRRARCCTCRRRGAACSSSAMAP